MYRRSQRWMLIINNRFLSLYDYNFLLVIQKIFSPPIPGFFINGGAMLRQGWFHLGSLLSFSWKRFISLETPSLIGCWLPETVAFAFISWDTITMAVRLELQLSWKSKQKLRRIERKKISSSKKCVRRKYPAHPTAIS